jgi:tRNA dimethylallyltransferase
MSTADQKQTVIVVCGPTGIGKTGTAIEIARGCNGEIVGADSMQIYRHMDIGTAKPTPEEQVQIRHHMIDIIDPDEDFDALNYAEMAGSIIAGLDSRGIVPFVVGGTGFYIKALLHGLYPSAVVDPAIRARLRKEAEVNAAGVMHRRLEKVDPEAAARLHPNDIFRIIRALETYEATGKPISKYHKEHGFSQDRYRALIIGLNMDREKLYERINQRVDLMIADGFLQEVKSLCKMGYGPELKSMQSIGYRHMLDYIAGRTDWEECVRTLKRDHRRYAKRQITWFGGNETIIWKEPRQISDIVRSVNEFLKME